MCQRGIRKWWHASLQLRARHLQIHEAHRVHCRAQAIAIAPAQRRAGDYAGLGVLGSIVNPNDAFLFSVNNDLRALLLGLER